MENIFVFEFDVLKYMSGEKVGTFHCLARSLFEASHIISEYAYGNGIFHEPVEIGTIRRLTSINYIINPEFILEVLDDDNDDDSEYDPELPYKVVANLPDTDPRIMKFKCSCKNEIRVHNGDWLFVECHECHNKIYRREVEEIGGKFIYVKLDKQ